ncbi:arginyl-tRNA synthetase [Haloarcula hispanica N601]|uniref:Arginine--tRNA ligase n=2 Tax=Haloarcula hispanica TaxID=51589 RepID=V5TIS2_HALHI|nr:MULTISPECIES: arginine--tRNA ligase [Haloarcula]AEM56059.1 arginyl-tRNA synthetase [Haloarcula hispanica ATCC 33960]AHB64872.1 arginyl-tRNA synthetase [Haloarcula hispanica N601]AJF26043.1 arginyl-tRNA synthetase [Haloarcula sp. CBA1115]
MFLQLRAEVEDALADALTALDLPAEDLGIEEPPEDVDAVLASSVAFRLAGEVGTAPPNVAGDIAEAIDTDDLTYVSAVTTQGPYVNFLPSEAYFAETLQSVTESEFGRLPDRDTSVVVEHTSANPTGPVHVGRARNPIIGDAVARVLDYAGYDVDRHYYVNDAGRQIAVFTWAYETFDESDLPEPERESPEYEMVRYYRKGNTVLEEGDPDEVEAAEAEVQSILQGLEDGDEETYERVAEVVDTVLGGMQNTLGRLPAEFDEFVKETRFMRNGDTDDLVDRLKDLDCAVYEEDAWQLDLPDFEKNLVFLRSDGTSLYTTRDLAHHEWKFDTYDRAVTVLGEDHKLQADQLSAALELLDNDTDQLRQVFYSWVNLPEGGMSTREGTGIDLDDLLDEAIDRAREEVESRLDDRTRGDLDADDIDRIARQVGIGAVRYDIVSKQPTKGITFEWDRALDFEAQSAPYVQYVHARCCGILGDVEADIPAEPDLDPLSEPEERDLLRELARFPAVIEAAADDLTPHTVATYTRDLAETFNAFYRECPVLDADDETRAARLALVDGTRTTIANALDALGVEAPTSM